MDPLKEIAKKHVLGNPVRLGIMIYLLPRRKALFSELLQVFDITPGNLDSHLRTLEKEKYITLRKVFADRPRSMVYITDVGAMETKIYLNRLKKALIYAENEK